MKGIRRGTVVAAGGLLWRIRKGELQVLAVHRPSYDDWSWPKGKIRRGETLPECAMREIYEETGKHITLGPALPTLKYTLSSGRPKVVKYWAVHATSPQHPALAARPHYKLAPKREIDKTRWMSVEQAMAKITMKADLKPLKALVKLHQEGRLDTETFLIARHARAKRRSAWKHEDLSRPITGGGTRRAHQLIKLFSAFGVKNVTSSPAARCMSTVLPYAAVIGTKVKTYPTLTEDAHAKNPQATADTLNAVFDKPGNRVVCVHRPTMPTLLDAIAQRMRNWTKGKLPSKNPYLPAGGVLVAHVLKTTKGRRIVSVETHLLS